jgi:hypothetical protein
LFCALRHCRKNKIYVHFRKINCNCARCGTHTHSKNLFLKLLQINLILCYNIDYSYITNVCYILIYIGCHIIGTNNDY